MIKDYYLPNTIVYFDGKILRYIGRDEEKMVFNGTAPYRSVFITINRRYWHKVSFVSPDYISPN